MIAVSKSRTCTISMASTLFTFAVFAFLWIYLYNRYFVLHYHEQIQLFRFDRLYFLSYLVQPGGLSGYAGSFLTQFYVYPVVGSIIIAIVLSAVFLCFYGICRGSGDIGKLFFAPFIPAVLLMVSFVDIYFDMSAAAGLLFMLAGFRWYVALRSPVRYFVGFLLFAVVFFVAGGNALLLTVMILIFELTGAKSLKDKLKNKMWYIPALIGGSILLPWLAWRICYVDSIREVFFSLTPLAFSNPTIFNQALWLSFPVLYLLWRLAGGVTQSWRFSPWKLIVPDCLLVAVMTACCAYAVYDRKAEMLNRMYVELQNGNMESVMALGKDFPANNRLACYFTNIALIESGQMPYRMFQYRQTGPNGLFLDRRLSYSLLWYLGEIYYRSGMIPEAEHAAFEALVSSPKEPNVQAIRRLALTNIIRRDSATACKYLLFLDHSLAYRQWAQQQRVHLVSAMADPAFHVPDTPIPYHNDDFFINYQKPDYALFMLLQTNPKHRMAFEYLMAYLMLQKNFEQVKWCMDRYFGNFDYQGIPAHYEEVLLICKNLAKAGNEFFTQYPVSPATIERYNQYLQKYKIAQTGKHNFELYEKQFGNTYWYYVHNIEPSPVQ